MVEAVTAVDYAAPVRQGPDRGRHLRRPDHQDSGCSSSAPMKTRGSTSSLASASMASCPAESRLRRRGDHRHRRRYGLAAARHLRRPGAELEDKRTWARWTGTSPNHRATFTYSRAEETADAILQWLREDNTVVLSSNWYIGFSTTDNYRCSCSATGPTTSAPRPRSAPRNTTNSNGAALDQPRGLEGRPAHGLRRRHHRTSARTSSATRTGSSAKRLNATFSGTYYVGNHAIKGGITT